MRPEFVSELHADAAVDAEEQGGKAGAVFELVVEKVVAADPRGDVFGPLVAGFGVEQEVVTDSDVRAVFAIQCVTRADRNIEFSDGGEGEASGDLVSRTANQSLSSAVILRVEVGVIQIHADLFSRLEIESKFYSVDGGITDVHRDESGRCIGLDELIIVMPEKGHGA